ncbi:MAG: hypothetical protein VX726_02030 [Planctomycetota bacterium]|nr:hypothetical protein [Planctomycetota bacterium]
MLNVTLFLDESRSTEEREAFGRLVVGLAAEGVHATQIRAGTPADSRTDHATVMDRLLPEFNMPDRAPVWLRDRLATATIDLVSDDHRTPDLCIAAGSGMLWLASRMASALEVPLLAEARSAAEVDLFVRRDVETIVTATESLCDRAARRLGSDRCTHLPVPVPRTETEREEGLVVVLGPVGSQRRWSALVEGLAGPGGIAHGARHVALELGTRRRDERIWRLARRSALSDRFSTFDHADRMRGLLAGASVVVCPDPGAVVRSIELQARIGGALVAGVSDDARDDRRHDLGDRLLSPEEATRPAAWREAIEEALAATPSVASSGRGRESLVSEVAPRWTSLLQQLIRGDATPIADPD